MKKEKLKNMEQTYSLKISFLKEQRKKLLKEKEGLKKERRELTKVNHDLAVNHVATIKLMENQFYIKQGSCEHDTLFLLKEDKGLLCKCLICEKEMMLEKEMIKGKMIFYPENKANARSEFYEFKEENSRRKK